MKFVWLGALKAITMSLPVRGAWVEMVKNAPIPTGWIRSLPVRGAWVEIDGHAHPERHTRRRSPCGERGLK